MIPATLGNEGEIRLRPDRDRQVSMRITIAICTHDRARQLARTLDSLEALDVPPAVDWRVLVVANACSDETPDVLEHYIGRLPLRWVREERAGHSHARNRAVEEAEGDYFIWTDDDVRVHRRWLAAYAEAFDRWPDAAFFGGPIEPVFEGSPPGWLLEAFEALEAVRGAYAARNLGPEPLPIAARDDLPYGANMAIPASVQRNYRYDPRLGRAGSDLVGGDELAVLGALVDDGHEGRWVPEARLQHVIPEERQSLSYLRRYFRDQGRVAEPLPEDRPVPELLGRPRWALRARVEEEIKYQAKRLLARPPAWMPHLIKASFAHGALLDPPEESHQRR